MRYVSRLRCFTAIALCLCLLLLSVPAVWAEEGEETTEARLPVCYQQNDPRWGDREQLAPGGCGILSLVNAVHFLTGNFIDPVELAAYARSIDAYYGSVGGGTARWVLYHQLDDYEQKYGFDVVQTGKDAGAKHPMLLEHLAAGGTAVAHVKGHFIALCGYDEATDSILVYDPAATPDRQTTTEPAWKTTDFLSTHARMTVDWWCLISRTGNTEVTLEGVREEGKNRELIATVRAGQNTEEPLTLKGTVKHRDSIESMFYVLDYDSDHPVEANATLSGGRSASFAVTVDTSEWSKGQHTLRLSARTQNGSVVDVAEYTVFMGNSGDSYDPSTGTLILDLSGFVGQKGVVSDVKAIQAKGYAFRAHPDEILYLGSMDLSQYTAVRFYYSVRDAFFGKEEQAVIGLRSTATSFGSRGNEANMVGAVATAQIPAADLALSQTQIVTVDLTDCNYVGELWFSVYHPARQFFYLREIRFYTGEVPPETLPETDAVTEELTVPDTEPASGADTVPTAGENGCSGQLSAGVWIVSATLGVACAVGFRRKKQEMGE